MDFIKGFDLSTLIEVERCGGKFYDNGVMGDAISILKSYGANSVRVKLFNDPYSETGRPYGAGGNDIFTDIELIKRVKEAGLTTLFDFHYSDFWADPGKQRKPKAWRNYNANELEKAVYDFTKSTLLKLKEFDLYPEMIQIGNELTNGLLWPEGQLWSKEDGNIDNYDNVASFISAGIRAAREINPDTTLMIHLDNGGNNPMYVNWFDHYFERGEDFDCIGLSYYPFWHGDTKALENNLNDLAVRYKKDLIIAEVSMGHTMEDYQEYEQLPDELRKGMATRPELAAKVEYPMTHAGQSDFMKRIMDIIKAVPDNRGKGFYYWEPAWIPVPGSGWATKESVEYMLEKGPYGNEWANQALFDYDGNALPALKTIRDFK